MPITMHGVEVTFKTSGFSAEITSFAPPGTTRESIDTSHAGTVGAKTFMPGDLVDNGEMGMTIHFDPADEPPVDGAIEEIEIEWPGGETWTFDGFLIEYAPADTATEGDDKVEASITVKVSGAIDIADAGS